MTDVLGQGRDEMMPVDLSLLELAPVQPKEAPVSFAYEEWVAAGKPCLRQSRGHHHADHIPSEAMECNQCDCLRFVGLILTIADATATTAYNDPSAPGPTG
jgi:hypothetical protein